MQGTLQVRPCKLDGAIHGANAPAWPTRPTFDSFLPRPTTEKKKEKQKRIACCARSVSTKVDTYQQPREPTTAIASRSTPCVDDSFDV
ncbi:MULTISPECIES: hypothetical protein [Stenotrophomonas]|nr:MULTISPECIES: hypothetical protein [Stenotrophomonas]MBH1488556.1 hypothetical protein [Stenotrophomonas maltophilia]MDH1393713.1 hypothetical protein [Stenotrophomonas sp. GD03702]